jgi:hypothetical protein
MAAQHHSLTAQFEHLPGTAPFDDVQECHDQAASQNGGLGAQKVRSFSSGCGPTPIVWLARNEGQRAAQLGTQAVVRESSLPLRTPSHRDFGSILGCLAFPQPGQAGRPVSE